MDESDGKGQRGSNRAGEEESVISTLTNPLWRKCKANATVEPVEHRLAVVAKAQGQVQHTAAAHEPETKAIILTRDHLINTQASGQGEQGMGT